MKDAERTDLIFETSGNDPHAGSIAPLASDARPALGHPCQDRPSAGNDDQGVPEVDGDRPKTVHSLPTSQGELAEKPPLQVSDAFWPDLNSIDEPDLPAFPVNSLPDPFREWVVEEAMATQTPADLAGMLALAVGGASLAKRVKIAPRGGWFEPVNLFVAVLLDSGNRKSAVFKHATQPLLDLESRMIEIARPEFEIDQSKRRRLEQKLAKAEKQAAGGDDPELEREADDLARELAERKDIVLPRLLVDDATPEKLEMMLAAHGGRIASMSPEGGVFDLMAGRYSKGSGPQMEVYLKGHCGDTLITDRVSREGVRVEDPALTCAYAIQPAVIASLAGNHAAFRGKGLLARFLFATPRSLVGHRDIATPPVSAGTIDRYKGLVTRLCNVQGQHVLRLGAGAEPVFQQWEREVEESLRDGEQLELMRDWGSKLPGATLRIAAILHCVEHAPAGEVTVKSLQSAIEVARYLIPHAQAALDLLQATDGEVLDDARYVLRWISRHEHTQFSRRDCQQHGRRRFFGSNGRIDNALSELQKRGYIRERKTQQQGAGRRQSPVYDVNPAVWEWSAHRSTSQSFQAGSRPPTAGNSEDIEDETAGGPNDFSTANLVRRAM